MDWGLNCSYSYMKTEIAPGLERQLSSDNADGSFRGPVSVCLVPSTPMRQLTLSVARLVTAVVSHHGQDNWGHSNWGQNCHGGREADTRGPGQWLRSTGGRQREREAGPGMAF